MNLPNVRHFSGEGVGSELRLSYNVDTVELAVMFKDTCAIAVTMDKKEYATFYDHLKVVVEGVVAIVNEHDYDILSSDTGLSIYLWRGVTASRFLCPRDSVGSLVAFLEIKDEEQEGETKVLRMVKGNQIPTLVYIPRTRTLEIKTTTSTVVSVSFSESQWESFLTHAQDFVSLIDTRDEYAMLAVHSVGYSLQAGEEELYFILKGGLVAAVYTVPYNEAAKLIDFLRSE